MRLFKKHKSMKNEVNRFKIAIYLFKLTIFGPTNFKFKTYIYIIDWKRAMKQSKAFSILNPPANQPTSYLPTIFQ